MSAYYYLNEKREPQGPHSLTELVDMMAEGRITPMTLIACKGAASWEPLGSILSRENIPTPGTPDITPDTPGNAGNCPKCQHPLTTENNKLPARCPNCQRKLRPAKSGIWANFIHCFQNYAQFSGRATRAEYWSFQLINFLICILIYSGIIGSLIAAVINIKDAQQLAAWETVESDHELKRLMLETIMNSDAVYLFPIVIGCLFALVFWIFFALIPSLSVFVRRLHDVGWSGWWLAGGMLFGFIVGAMGAPLEAAAERGVEVEPGLYTSITGILQILSYCASLFFFVLTLMDSVPGPNKYGPSSKYPQG